MSDLSARLASLRSRIDALRKIIDNGELYDVAVDVIETQEKVKEVKKEVTSRKSDIDDIKAKLMKKK